VAPGGRELSRSSPVSPVPPTTTSLTVARLGTQMMSHPSANSAVRSLAECTAMSARPSTTSRSTSLVNRPLPPICA
jgi:hypothetical protein